MTPTDAAIALLLGLVTLCTRLAATVRAGVSFDTYGHLYMVKEVREQKAGPFGEVSTRVVHPARLREPFLWHWTIGRLPFPFVMRNQRWINPVLDALFTSAVYWIAIATNIDRQAALWTALLYALTPIWFSRLAIGPRVNSLTPRLAAEIVTNLFFIATLWPAQWPLPIRLAAGAVCGFWVIASSKFGRQALLLLVPIVSILVRTWMPLAALVLAFLLAAVISRGEIVASFRAQLGHLRWYAKKHRRGEAAISKRNQLRTLFARAPGTSTREYVLGIVQIATAHNSYTSVLIKMPVLPIALGLAIAGPWPVFAAPVIAGVIAFFLINLPPLLFLGEAERYLHHVAIFITATAASLAFALNMQVLLWALAIHGALYLLAEVLILPRLRSKTDAPREAADRDVLAYLSSIDPSVVLGYPYHAVGAHRIMIETDHRVVFHLLSTPEFIETFEKEYADTYPYAKLDRFDALADAVGAGVLIITRSALAERGREGWTPAGPWERVAAGSPIYDVYRRRADGPP